MTDRWTKVARRVGVGIGATILLASTAGGAATTGNDTPAERATPFAAPPFALPGRDGARHRLADYRGDVVYLDFWASWCGPCLQSFPWMNDIAERYRLDGLRVLAINLDVDRMAATDFLLETRADFDVAFDAAGETAEAYGLLGMPSSYVIDRDGRVVHAHVGFRRDDRPALEAAIARAVAARGASLAEAE